jgi:hypothetical protein
LLWDRKEPAPIALRSIDVVQQLFLRGNPDLGEIVKCLSYELLNAECLDWGGRTFRDCHNISQRALKIVNEYYSVPWDRRCSLSERLLGEWELLQNWRPSQKALCLLTTDYEAIDFADAIWPKGNYQIAFAEDFTRTPLEIATHALNKIKHQTQAPPDSQDLLVLVGSHPVLETILDYLNGPEIGSTIAIGSGFTTAVTVKGPVRIVLIADFENLTDRQDLLSVQILDRAQICLCNWSDFASSYLSSVIPQRCSTELTRNLIGALADQLLSHREPASDCQENPTGPFHTSLESLCHQWRDWQRGGLECPLFWSDSQALDGHLTFVLSKTWASGIRAVVVTKGRISLPGPCVPPERPIVVLDDDTCRSSVDLVESVRSQTGDLPVESRPVVVLKCTRYAKLHHAHLRFLFDTIDGLSADVFIVYYQVKEEVASTFRWPVFFIEDVSDFEQFGGVGYSYEQVDDWLRTLERYQEADGELLEVLGRMLNGDNLHPSDNPDYQIFAERLELFRSVLPAHKTLGWVLSERDRIVLSGLPARSEVDSIHVQLIKAIRYKLRVVVKPLVDLVPCTTDQELNRRVWCFAVLQCFVQCRSLDLFPHTSEFAGCRAPYISIFIPFGERLLRNEPFKDDIIETFPLEIEEVMRAKDAVGWSHCVRELYCSIVERQRPGCSADFPYNGSPMFVGAFDPFRGISRHYPHPA